MRYDYKQEIKMDYLLYLQMTFLVCADIRLKILSIQKIYLLTFLENSALPRSAADEYSQSSIKSFRAEKNVISASGKVISLSASFTKKLEKIDLFLL